MEKLPEKQKRWLNKYHYWNVGEIKNEAREIKNEQSPMPPEPMMPIYSGKVLYQG